MKKLTAAFVWAMSVLVGCGGGGGSPETSIVNSPPVANAGTAAQSVVSGEVVALNGSASSDANGDSLSYIWTLTSRPAGSSAALNNSTSANASFLADIAGTYVVTLTVNDGKVNSSSSTTTVTASASNTAPIANAGAAQSVMTGTAVTLNGSASSDANGDPLTYSWTLTGRPTGSTATLINALSATPSFSADAAGTYVASLTVNDGKVNSASSTTTVTAAVANAAPVANAGAAQSVVAGVTDRRNRATDVRHIGASNRWVDGRPEGVAPRAILQAFWGLVCLLR